MEYFDPAMVPRILEKRGSASPSVSLGTSRKEAVSYYGKDDGEHQIPVARVEGTIDKNRLIVVRWRPHRHLSFGLAARTRFLQSESVILEFV
jgi:hypothetical protein